MRWKFQKPIVVVCLLVVCSGSVLAQQQVGIPFDKQRGFVLEFPEPYDRLVLDLGETPFSTDEATEVLLDPNATFINHKKKPIDKTLLRPGMDVEIEGEYLGTRVTVQWLRVKTDIDDWKVASKGYFELLDENRAKIDGQTVVLEPGVVIKGDGAWKKKRDFNAFGEMMLGSEVEVAGVRRLDGIIYVRKGKTWPNDYEKNDRKLVEATQQGLELPASSELSGGRVTIGGREFKLVESLAVQSYVTQVGTTLLPGYIKDPPGGEPPMITYRFFVIEDSSFNAFGLPDGSVFVHTGLLGVLENEAQLAAVLGHEIAHVTHEHGRKRYESQLQKAGRIAKALVDKVKKDKPGAIEPIGFEYGIGLASNIYSRKQEDQADRVGLFYLVEAGYDPREAPRVWRKIADLTAPGSEFEAMPQDAEPFLFSDHASARQRLKHLSYEIAYNYYDTDFSQTIIGGEAYRSLFHR